MKLVNLKNFCMLMCAIVFSSTLFAEAAETLDAGQVVAQQQKQQRNRKNNNSNGNMGRDPNTWTPYYLSTRDTEPMSSFYQQTVGIGFLYFSGIKGNLNSYPTGVVGFNTTGPKTNRSLTGHIGYNRTPVAEYIIGKDVWFWFKIALSYTHQGGIVMQTRPQTASTLTNGVRPDFTSHVRLDAAMARVYFMLPYTLVWKNAYYEPYLSLGVGPGWQTWADIKSIGNISNTIRQKVSANCVFTVDLGAKLRKAMPTYVMSFTVGCKFTDWGQARSMGKINNQYASSTILGGTSKQAFTNPFRIKTVYQFAPYVGVQFNF